MDADDGFENFECGDGSQQLDRDDHDVQPSGHGLDLGQGQEEDVAEDEEGQEDAETDAGGDESGGDVVALAGDDAGDEEQDPNHEEKAAPN